MRLPTACVTTITSTNLTIRSREEGIETNRLMNVRKRTMRSGPHFACRIHPLQFSLGHEGHKKVRSRQRWQVHLSSRVLLENERDHIRVDYDRIHAARSVLVCPRHSRSAARKSSMFSSSGQKSPNSSRGSEVGIVP